jgi:glyoxylase-like metal-dependent hydrolase (beta-lactamase superfamily II)
MRELKAVVDGVFVATSRTMSTTSTVVAHGGSVLLVDPAWHPDELASLGAELTGRELRVVAGFATHAHHDHLLWYPRFGEAPRFASESTARLAVTDRAALVKALGTEFPEQLAELMGRVLPTQGAIPTRHLPTGITAELIIHDGHAPGHSALWLDHQRVLIAGDMLSDVEVPLPYDDLDSYLEGLDKLAPFVARADVVIPGHGTPGTRPLERLDADRRYLDAVMRGRVPDDRRLADSENHDQYTRLVELVSAGDAGRHRQAESRAR